MILPSKKKLAKARNLHEVVGSTRICTKILQNRKTCIAEVFRQSCRILCYKSQSWGLAKSELRVSQLSY